MDNRLTILKLSKKGGNKMSEAHRKKIDKLKDSGKLTDYEAEQLLRLNSIESILLSLEASLNSINSLLVHVYQKIGAK